MKKYLIFLFLIFVLAYFLRVMFLPSRALTFGYDQARDAVNATQIAYGHLKIFGPPASQPGLFHGALYYYVLAPAYLFGQGSPLVAGYWVAFINSLTLLVVFYLGYLMTKKVSVGLLAAFLFAISFEATQYATWLSNPTLGILTVSLMYLGLWMWINPTSLKLRWARWVPIIAAIGLGLSIQSEIFLIYHIIPLAIWLWIGRKNITRKQLTTFVIILLLTLSTMVMAQLKFGLGATLTAVRQLSTSSDPNLAYAKSIGDYAILYLNQIGRIFSFNSYPGNAGYGGGLVIALILYSFFAYAKNAKKKIIDPRIFLCSWLISHLSVVTVGGTSTPFLMVGIGPAVSLLIAMFLGQWWNKNYKIVVIALLVILTFANISMIMKENSKGSTLFSIQSEMTLAHELPAIDYTYQESKGKPFAINTITSPLWVNIVWTYLYNWYGQPKYGYVPYWSGKGQEGQLVSLPKATSHLENNFLIIEPLGGIPTRFVDETIGEMNSYTTLISKKNFGEIVVEKRIGSKN